MTSKEKTMPKRKKAVKTIDQIDADIARWQRRLKMAVGKIEKLQKQRKYLSLLAAAPATGKAIADKAVKDIIDRDTRGTDAPKVICVVEDSPLKAPAKPADDLDDIPTFLQRPKMSPEAEEIVARLAKVKTIKAATAKAKRAESKARDAIPKSKRRWDTTKSRWISD